MPCNPTPRTRFAHRQGVLVAFHPRSRVPFHHQILRRVCSHSLALHPRRLSLVPLLPCILLLQVSLTTSDWDECSHWLTALKRLIKARHQMG